METWNLYYDGGCNLCHMSKLRAERWAERAGRPLHVEVLQSEEALEKSYGVSDMVLEADGRVFKRADAWLKLMTLAPWPLRWVSWFRLSAPTRWLARLAYEIVARVRFIIWGRRTCPLPARKP